MSELKVMGGKYKGMNLKVPYSARPVTTRVKAVIFDTLMNNIEGANVLDLFAGSGNLGIEAISRGALKATFVDHDKFSMKDINENLEKLGIDERIVINSDYKTFIKSSSESFDLIFIDPPFDFIRGLNLNAISEILNPEGIVVLKSETKTHPKLPKGLKILLEKKLGENTIYFLTHNNE